MKMSNENELLEKLFSELSATEFKIKASRIPLGISFLNEGQPIDIDDELLEGLEVYLNSFFIMKKLINGQEASTSEDSKSVGENNSTQ